VFELDAWRLASCGKCLQNVCRFVGSGGNGHRRKRVDAESSRSKMRLLQP
jgi:hypothetical protein